MRILAGVSAVFVFLFALTAAATIQDDWETELGATCDEFENHSGFVPGSYDVGVFIEGATTEVHYTNGEDLNVDPPGDEPFGWDTVLKCHLNPTTTTTPSTTTPTSTTTIPATTTTTDVTTTEPSTTTTVSTDLSTTTTTQAPTTRPTTPTTIQPPTTTSTTVSETTTSSSTTTTEVVATTDPPKELPLTGANLSLLLLAAASLLTVGLLTIRRSDQ